MKTALTKRKLLHKIVLVLATAVANWCVIFSLAADEFEQHGAHVHGEAHLLIAQDEDQLILEFNSAAWNIVGFEHQPNTDLEKNFIAAALKKLQLVEKLFKFEPEVCQFKQLDIDNPFKITDGNKIEEKQLKDKEAEQQNQSTHCDFKVIYEYSCKDAQKLAEIQVNLIEAFGFIHKLHVEWIVNNQQGSKTLVKSQDVVKFTAK